MYFSSNIPSREIHYLVQKLCNSALKADNNNCGCEYESHAKDKKPSVTRT